MSMVYKRNSFNNMAKYKIIIGNKFCLKCGKRCTLVLLNSFDGKTGVQNAKLICRLHKKRQMKTKSCYSESCQPQFKSGMTGFISDFLAGKYHDPLA